MDQHIWSVPPAEVIGELQTAPQGLTADEAHFQSLPVSFLLITGVIVLLYILAAEVAKEVFYNKVKF